MTDKKQYKPLGEFWAVSPILVCFLIMAFVTAYFALSAPDGSGRIHGMTVEALFGLMSVACAGLGVLGIVGVVNKSKMISSNDYVQLNAVLADLNAIRYNSSLVERVVEKEIDDPDGEQGENGVSYEVYKLPFDGETFIKLTITTDSYGNNETVSGVQFVRPVTKQVTAYEAVSGT